VSTCWQPKRHPEEGKGAKEKERRIQGTLVVTVTPWAP